MTPTVAATSSDHLSSRLITIDYKYPLSKFSAQHAALARDLRYLPRYNLVMERADAPPRSAATELRESIVAVNRQMRRHRPDHGLTLSQMELLGEISRTGVTTPAELGTRLHVRVQSLTDSINALEARGLIGRRPDEADRRRQLIEITAAGHRAAGGRPRGTRRMVARHHARQPLAARVRPGDARRAGAAQAGIRRHESGHTSRMTRSRTSTTAQEWIAHDPDPKTAAELLECSDADLDERFAHALTFGTAGLRGPLRGGPNGMNLAVVLRATWAVAKVLKDRGLQGRDVVVGRDARHGSDEFALAAAEVLAAQGFPVTLMFAAVPTPVVAFAVRHGGAVAGIQITASHNPPSDNGYKVYFEGGFPIVPPTDRDIEQAMSAAPHADEIPRQAVVPSGVDEVQRYVERAAQVRHSHGSVRVAVTPLHGVGGEYLMDALVRAGFTDVHVVDDQFAPDPDFPTVALPNPEEPGAVDAVLKARRRRRRRHCCGAGSRCGPVRGRGADTRRLADAVRRRNRLATRRLPPLPDRTGSRHGSHRGGEFGGLVAHARGHRDRRTARATSRH